MDLRKITPKQNKKIKKPQGFIELLLVVVFLLAVALFILILNKVWGEVRTPLGDALEGVTPANAGFNTTRVLDQTSGAARSFDALLPFLIIGLIAFVMISAGAYLQHPIMLFVGVIMLGVVIVIAVIYSNAYQAIAESSSFSSTNSNLPIQSKFMQWLPIIGVLILGGVIISLVWSRRGYGGGGL